MHSERLMTNNNAVKKNARLLLEFLHPGCFSCFFLRAHQQQCRSVGGTIWDMRVYLCCYWGGASLNGCPGH